VKTILLVEDEFGLAEILAMTLEDDGYRVVPAANGRQGLERLAAERPDLILLDVTMPVMDGAALGLAVRADRAFDGIPIVMMSALPEAALRERFTAYDEFLRKPFRLAAMREAVARLLGDRSGRED
jgi:CheY-like chemotaxis protein